MVLVMMCWQIYCTYFSNELFHSVHLYHLLVLIQKELFFTSTTIHCEKHVQSDTHTVRRHEAFPSRSERGEGYSSGYSGPLDQPARYCSEASSSPFSYSSRRRESYLLIFFISLDCCFVPESRILYPEHRMIHLSPNDTTAWDNFVDCFLSFLISYFIQLSHQ